MEQIKLNLGCGEHKLEGYINTDIDSGIDPDIVCDVTNAEAIAHKLKQLYPDGYEVIKIRAWHLIEHFQVGTEHPYRELAKIIKGWHWLLCDGGKLHIACPDTEAIAKSYGGEHFSKRALLRKIYGFQTTPYQSHCMGYDKETLTKVLVMAGFKTENIQCEEVEKHLALIVTAKK